MKTIPRGRQGVPSRSSTGRTLLLACCLLLFPGKAVLPAAETPTELLQRGLIEEEANRNPAAAIKAYEEVVRQLDTQRQMAATAVFRLGESYRKLGRTNDAVAQYRRIVQQFPEETALATLSRQNLTGLGATWNEPGTNGVPVFKDLPGAGRQPEVASSKAASEAARLEAQLGELKNAQPLDKYELAIAFFEDEVLKELQSAHEKRRALLGKLSGEVGPEHPTYVAEDKARQDVFQRRRERLDLIVRIQEANLRILKTQAGSATAAARSQPVNPETAEIERLTALLKASPDLLNAPGAGGKTFLQNAAEQGQLQVVQFLLDQKARIDGGGGLTALHYAVAAGHKAVVELLLGKGADVNSQNSWGVTPAHLATAFNRTVVLQTLLQKMPDLERVVERPRDSLSESWSFESNGGSATFLQFEGPLLVACRLGNPVVTELLIKAGAKASGREVAGMRGGPLSSTAFNLPASDRNREQLLTLLVANGAAADRTDMQAALKSAAGAGNTNALRILLKADPLPAVLNAGLVSAVRAKKVESVKLLLANKADPMTTDTPTKQPLLFDAILFSTPEIVDALLAAGADPNLLSALGSQNNSIAPLHYAVDANRPGFVPVLVRHGAKIDMRATYGTEGGLSPLHLAVRSSISPVLLREILDAKADVNPQASDGATPLHWAVKGGLVDNVRLLLESKADPNLGDANDIYPIDLTWQDSSGRGSSPALRQILLTGGARTDMPRWKKVRVMGGLDTERYSLRKGSSTNLVAELGLMELLVVASPPFPDWAKVRIIRPNRSGSGREIIPADASKLLGDPAAADVALRWGDVVDVPETDRALGAQWSGFDKATADLLLTRTKRRVTVVAGGTTNFVELGHLNSGSVSAFIVSVPAKLSGVISQKTSLRTSSDLSRVRVTRKAAPGETTSWVFDARPWKPGQATGRLVTINGPTGAMGSSEPTDLPDLWLRDGDVVEVPETDAR